jgi:hypothetical protein
MGDTGVNRRQFLGRASGLAAAGMMMGTTGAIQALSTAPALAATSASARRDAAYKVRVDRAKYWKNAGLVAHPTNGDEALYANRISCYTKGMPHDSYGVVDSAAYSTYLAAIDSETTTAFEAVPLGGTMKLSNPMAAYAYVLEGGDPHNFTMPAFPTFDSADLAAELVELYWMALLRDVPFSDYAAHPDAAAAAAELATFSRFSGMTTGKLFRGPFASTHMGPYISQLLYKDIPYGATGFAQKGKWAVPGVNHATTLAECVSLQNGIAPSASLSFDSTLRYVRTGRDLAGWVHRDFTYQGGLSSALILLSYGAAALDANNPYKSLSKQGNFVTWGGPMILQALGAAADLALKAAWYQKWLVHRQVRPECYTARVETTATGALAHPVNAAALNSQGLARTQSAQGSALLSQVYPEGSPTHPSYPAGHAVLAGALSTILKAFFDESFAIPDPVQPSADGTTLEPYSGTLTIGSELNKLAYNVARGRDIAGVHWYSDGHQGVLLGEQVAISVLRDLRATVREANTGFVLTNFAGNTVTI